MKKMHIQNMKRECVQSKRQAIMGSPEIVLLDEPINAIDGEGVEQIRQLILGLRDENRVVLVACHDKEEMQLLADDIICMQQGRIVEKG